MDAAIRQCAVTGMEGHRSGHWKLTPEKEVQWGNFIKHTHTHKLHSISKQAKSTHGDYQFLVCMVNPSIS